MSTRSASHARAAVPRRSSRPRRAVLPALVVSLVCLVCLVAASVARAEPAYLYPVVWPRAFGGRLSVVPVGDAKVVIYEASAAPTLLFGPAGHAGHRRLPAPTVSPTSPYELELPAAWDASEDWYLFVLSSERAVVIVGDDDRCEDGGGCGLATSGSRMHAFSQRAAGGPHRGEGLYGQVNGVLGSDARHEPIVFYNPGPTDTVATLSSWLPGAGGAWAWSAGDAVVAVPAGRFAMLDTARLAAGRLARVAAPVPLLTLGGTASGGAAALAVDEHTGDVIGTSLVGRGTRVRLHAVTDLSAALDVFDTVTGAWAPALTLVAEVPAGTTQDFAPALTVARPMRLRLTEGKGWAVMGAWDGDADRPGEGSGYFLPAHDAPAGCALGSEFYAPGAGRLLWLRPSAGDASLRHVPDDGGALRVFARSAAAPWSLWAAAPGVSGRLHMVRGPGLVLYIASTPGIPCGTGPPACGIRRGAYLAPELVVDASLGGAGLPELSDLVPACGAADLPDGGTDGGTDGGADAGADAGADDGGDAGAGGGDGGGTRGPADAAPGRFALHGGGGLRCAAGAAAGAPRSCPAGVLLGVLVALARRRHAWRGRRLAARGLAAWGPLRRAPNREPLEG